MTRKVTEGYMPFKGFQTYYRIVGEGTPGKAPLIMLHGGPGSTHNYFEVLDDLADDGRQIIMYDQLGCGNSYVEGHDELWHVETWDEELIALREHLGLDECHLLGQSWGVMLEIEYVCNYQPKGIKSMILSSGLASCELWAQEQHRQMKLVLTPEEQKAVTDAEASGDFSSPLLAQATDKFMQYFCCESSYGPDDPECLRRKPKKNPMCYLSTQGANEFGATGSFKDWEYRDKIGGIEQPCLVINGTNDLCTPLVAKNLYDSIPNAEWELFPNCRHMCFVEAHDKYKELVTKWLNDHD